MRLAEFPLLVRCAKRDRKTGKRRRTAVGKEVARPFICDSDLPEALLSLEAIRGVIHTIVSAT